MTLIRALTIAAAAAITLAGCSSTTTDKPAAGDSEILAAYDLDGLDPREIVDRLDRAPVDTHPPGLTASVRADHLLISDSRSDASTTLALPDDEFYLSLAPFLDQTHDCYYHSLTTCRGELAGEAVQVTITDLATGDVLVDEATTTFANGFIGYWLPRDIDATVRVDHNGRSGSVDVSTGPEDPTCLTTLQLGEPG